MDTYAEVRQREIERLGLWPEIISVYADEIVVSMHYHVATKEVWCVESSPNGGVGAYSLGVQPGIVGGLVTERYQIICGIVPVEAYAVEVTAHMDQNVQTHRGEGVFVAIVPPMSAAIVSFKNAQGAITHVHPIAPLPPLPRSSWLSKLRGWAQDQGLLPAPRGSYTYPQRHTRR